MPRYDDENDRQADRSVSPIPTDLFSQTLRQLRDNPGALHASSRIDCADFYGNAETWNVDTFRTAFGDTVFLQRSSAAAPLRLMLPPDVTKALANHRDRTAAAGQRQAGHRLIAQRRERGDTLGNPDALRKARQARKAKSGQK
jgi:hypothetical protein